eukprot:2503381-Prymnesium_polylepis.2
MEYSVYGSVHVPYATAGSVVTALNALRHRRALGRHNVGCVRLWIQCSRLRVVCRWAAADGTDGLTLRACRRRLGG